jgi:hypothetical protein
MGINTFREVVDILDAAVNGPETEVGSPHHAFWRNVTRDQFVATTILGQPILVLGDGAHSNLILCLKGELPLAPILMRSSPACQLVSIQCRIPPYGRLSCGSTMAAPMGRTPPKLHSRLPETKPDSTGDQYWWVVGLTRVKCAAG